MSGGKLWLCSTFHLTFLRLGLPRVEISGAALTSRESLFPYRPLIQGLTSIRIPQDQQAIAILAHVPDFQTLASVRHRDR
jgi:hypothetical protein